MSMLLQFKLSSLPTAVFESTDTHIVCCRHTDTKPLQLGAKMSGTMQGNSSSSSSFATVTSPLPDGFLVVDVLARALIWYTRSGQSTVRMFSDSSKTLIDPAVYPTKADQAPKDGAFCILQGDQYVAVLTSKLSMVLHKIKGWEYFELPLSCPTTKIQSCEFGLLLSVLISYSPYARTNSEKRQYQIVTDPLVMPIDVLFYVGAKEEAKMETGTDNDSNAYDDDDHHELLRVDGDHVLFITTVNTKTNPERFLTLWRLEKVTKKFVHGEVETRSRSDTATSASNTATDYINSGTSNFNNSKYNYISGNKRRIDRKSPAIHENGSNSPSTNTFRTSPLHSQSQPSSPRPLEQLLGLNDGNAILHSMGRDSSSPLGFFPQTQMPSLQPSLSLAGSMKNATSGGKYSGRPSPLMHSGSPVSHSSSPYSRWNNNNASTSNVSEPSGRNNTINSRSNVRYRFRKLAELPLPISEEVVNIDAQQSSIHALTCSFPPMKSQSSSDIREYSVVFEADPLAVYTFRITITSEDEGANEQAVISFESRRVSSNMVQKHTTASVATVRMNLDSVVSTGSNTLLPSLAIDVSLHLYGCGNLECYIYGYKCDLLMSSQASLAEEVVAIEDLGGNHILALYMDGRMAVLTVSWPPIFSPVELTTSKAITTDLISYLLKCFPFPPIILGQLINYLEVAHQNIKNEECPLSSCVAPLGWLLALCIDTDGDMNEVLGLWESQESLSSQHLLLYHKLREAIRDDSTTSMKIASLGFLLNCKEIGNTNRDMFACRIAVFVKNILSKLQSIGLSITNDKITSIGGDYTLGEALVKVFHQRYNELITKSQKESSQPCIHVLEAFLAAVSSLSSDFSDSSQESSSLVAFYALPPTIQVAISFSSRLALLHAKTNWPNWLLLWIGRTDIIASRSPSALLLDLAASTGSSSTSSSSTENKKGSAPSSASSTSSSTPVDELDGLKMVERLCTWRFPEDERLLEVSRLLRSSTPHYLRVERAPEADDKEHRHKQQLKLLSLCRRALATTIGRGMYTIDSLPTSPISFASSFHDKIPVCYTSLSGRVPPSNSVVKLDTSNAPAELTLWPDFHSGVAAGLRVAPAFDVSRFPAYDKKTVDNKDYSYGSMYGSRLVSRNWILYNRPVASNYQDMDELEAACLMDQDSAGYAGTLLGLGLLGHLKALTITDVCDFLTQSQEPMTVGLLIGLSASKIGSADSMLSKTLCLHLPALLPASHWDMEFSPLVQCAALTGLGLLHMGSAHRLMTEFLVAELSRSPSCAEKTDSREAVCLSAGWALGMVLLGRGSESYGEGNTIGNAVAGIVDLGIEDRLQQLIEGGKRPEKFSLFANTAPSVDINSKSSRLLECDDININVTSPGACVALGLMYIRTNNKLIASRLAIPTTAFALDHIRPDLLIFRSVASCLVDWNGTVPTEEWLMGKIPKVVLRTLEIINPLQAGEVLFQSKSQLGKRAALQVYLCSVAGLCWGIGLVFAGTMDMGAKNLLIAELKTMQRIRDGKPTNIYLNADKPTRPLVDLCLSVVSISLGLVLAGSGDVDGLRILRELRWKAEDGTYGSHLAFSMAIGLLFLAGGRASLRRDPTSVGALLLSTAPRFPSRTLDHQYHMQAQRHLYALAIEWRLLRVIDADSGKMISLSIDVVMKTGEVTSSVAPCLLTELSDIVEIRISTASKNNYIAENLKITEKLVSNHTVPPLFVKRYSVDGDDVISQKTKNASADMLQVSRMAAQYCLSFDKRMDHSIQDDDDDHSDEYLDYDNKYTTVPDIAANIAISMCRHKRERNDTTENRRNKMEIDMDGGDYEDTVNRTNSDNGKEEAFYMTALAHSLNSQALSMFGY